MRREDAKEKTVSIKMSQKMYTKIEKKMREKNYKNISAYIRDLVQAEQAKNELSKPAKQRAVEAICTIQTYINCNGDFCEGTERILDALKTVKEVLR